MSTAPAAELAADGLTLHRWTLQDLDGVVEAVETSRTHLAPWMSWVEGFRAEAAGEWLVSIIRAWEHGTDFTYAIRSGDRIIGAVGLHDDRGPGRLEVGYWVHVDHVGRGVARRATRAAVAAAFDIPEVETVELRHADTNVRSERVPEALGFRRVGEVPRDRTEEAGGSDTTIVWELTRAEATVALQA